MSVMQLFDSHCHLDVEEFDADRADVLIQARAAGVTELLIPGIYRDEWPQLRKLCAGDPRLYPALGLHPIYLDRHTEADILALEVEVARDRPIAIGEIGLDYFVTALDRARQQVLLEQQLAIAEAHHLPVALHVRKAHDAMLATLRRYRLVGGICHAFNGSLQQATKYIDMGFCLGFGGMLSYPRSLKLRRLAATLPLESLVLETDAPDMTGLAHQYQRNSPAYLPEVLNSLARLRGESATDVAKATTANTRRVLALAAG